MPRELPERPHADVLRRQARELLRAWKAGDALALARVAPYHLGPPRLADAQLVLAREYGLPSWTALKREVERRAAAAADDDTHARRVLRLALGHGFQAPQPARAAALLTARTPREGAAALALALVAGALPTVQRLLPRAEVRAPLAPWQAAPLALVAFSSLARLEAHRDGLRATLDWLLAQGADPNTRWEDPDDPGHALTVLYGATARAADAAMVRRLLAAGADPNDGESLYHATEQADRDILAALVAHGARWSGTNALLRQLDHDDLGGLRQALALGADPNEPGPGGLRPLHHALIRGRALPFLQALVAHGADPAAPDAQGRSPAWTAARVGDRQAQAWLLAQAQRGPTTTPGLALDPVDTFLAACAAADEAAARAALAELPGGLGGLPDEALRLLPDQAQRGRIESVRLMLRLGWPVAAAGDWGASALNQAAFRGDASMAALLIDHGARWDEPNAFGGDALGSCLHAAANQPSPGADHPAVLALLLAQGAPVPGPEDELPPALQAVCDAARAA